MLPYNLHIRYTESTDKTLGNLSYPLTPYYIFRLYTGYVKIIKPLLHPLSKLTDTSLFDGKSMFDIIAIYPNVEYLLEQIKTGMVEVIVWNQLLANHFNVYELPQEMFEIKLTK